MLSHLKVNKWKTGDFGLYFQPRAPVFARRIHHVRIIYMTELYEGERIDEVNDSLKLIQKTDGLTFGTDALLLAGYINTTEKAGLELGSGSGIISMLLLSRKKLSRAVALEVQESYAALTERNAEMNGLSDVLFCVNCDLRDFKTAESFDIVYTNPPYMSTSSGRANEISAKNLARHEVCGGIEDFCICAKKYLKYGGTFAAVYRPDRLTDLIYAMRKNSIEPKRMTFVHADTDSEPSMVLIEGRAGGRCGIKLTPPLIIYENKDHKNYTPDMNFIMENGSFPVKFKRI